MAGCEIAPLTSDHVRDAANVLVRAFVDDPGLHYVLPDREARERLSPALALAGTRYAIQCGKPLVTTGTVRGVALWFPPDAAPPSEADLRVTGIGEAPGLLGNAAWGRLKSMLDHLDGLHPLAAPDPHWYLTVLGVDPGWQRQGIGEALMQPVFDLADRDGVCCYLEAPTEGNARYYGRRGFDVVGETQVPDSDVHLWLMLRQPRH